MATIITVDDIPSGVASSVDSDVLATMVAGANARASRVAPCLATASADQKAEAKLILLGAITRWVQAGSGAYTQQVAGPYSVSTDTRQRSGYNLWPSEITQLQEICGTETREAFAVDTAPTISGQTEPLWWGYETGSWSGPYLGGATPG